MKNVLLLILLCCTESSFSQENSFSLEGEANIHTGSVYLHIPSDDGMTWAYLDSTKINNGLFTFKGKLKEPRLSLLKVFTEADTYLSYFFLSPTNQKVILNTQNFDSPKISGSIAQKEYDSLNYFKDLIREKYIKENEIWNELQTKYPESKKNDSIQNILDSIYRIFLVRAKELENEEIKFIRNHPASFVSASLLSGLIKSNNADLMMMFFKNLHYNIQNSSGGIKFKKLYEKYTVNKKGSLVSDFSAINTKNEEINFSTILKNSEVILLDFWASWCGPCRQLFPKLKEAYEKNKSKGFKIVTISLDSKKDEWIKAVTEDRISSFDNVIVNDTIRSKYINAVSAIPNKILINKRGEIIYNSLFQPDINFEDVLIETLQSIGK